MNAPVTTKTFKSGNSEAIRLPKGLGFGIDIEVRVERKGNSVILSAVEDADKVRAELTKLMADLDVIGSPADGIQTREPFEFPERPGL